MEGGNVWVSGQRYSSGQCYSLAWSYRGVEGGGKVNGKGGGAVGPGVGIEFGKGRGVCIAAAHVCVER